MLIKSIKDSIWNCIKDKEVALFMIFSDEGEILWRQGREVRGRNIMDGKGFCRSYCLEALKKHRKIAKADCLINLNGHSLSESALILMAACLWHLAITYLGTRMYMQRLHEVKEKEILTTL